MNFDQPATKESLDKTLSSLKANGYEVSVVKTGSEALEQIKSIIPNNASVMNGSSETLHQIGFIDYLKSNNHPWNNLHAAIVEEKDPAKQGELRKHAILSDYYLGSVHALSENGEMIIASNTGSQLPHIVYSSQNLIFVVSTKKITANLDEALKRVHEYVTPLEDARSVKAYGSGTKLNKLVIFYGESEYTGRKIHVILVEEPLGY